MTDFTILADADLATKLAWYTARNKLDHATAVAIAAEIAKRAEPTEEEAETEALPRSVVGVAYKVKYRLRNAGKGKAMRRGCGDWLHETLAPLTLNADAKLNVAAFEAILEANGVKHEGWNRTTPGWQGRLRMTGSLVLRRVVAEAEALVLPDGSTLEPPAEFIAKHAN